MRFLCCFFVFVLIGCSGGGWRDNSSCVRVDIEALDTLLVDTVIMIPCE